MRCKLQEKAINGTVSIFPQWFLKDVSNLGWVWLCVATSAYTHWVLFLALPLLGIGTTWMAYTSTSIHHHHQSTACIVGCLMPTCTVINNWLPKQNWYNLHVFLAYNTKCIGAYNGLFPPSLIFLPTSPSSPPHLPLHFTPFTRSPPPSLDLALDLEIAVTDVYTGSYFLEEIQGLADATGIDYKVKT